MDLVTEKDIDTLKDYMSSHREQLSEIQLTEMENEFIEKVNIYKQLYPHHTKTLNRWRNWYRLVRNDLHKKNIPKNEIELLNYHLETFKVESTDIAVKRLQNWINRITVNYTLDDKIIERINIVLNKYGYEYKL